MASPNEKLDKKATNPFQFKQFLIEQDRCAMKVGTDGVLLGAWANVDQTNSILDIGTGTGVIALMLAQRVHEVATDLTIHAVEIDETAFIQAKENIERSKFTDFIQIFKDSIQNFAQNSDFQYDLIVSNPPFFTGGTFSNNQDKNNVRHTVKLPHSDLLHATRSMLKPDGRFCVVLPLIEGLRFIDFAKNFGFFCTRRTDIFPRENKTVERLLLEFGRQAAPCVETQLVLREGDWYTAAYQDLTKDFYTIF